MTNFVSDQMLRFNEIQYNELRMSFYIFLQKLIYTVTYLMRVSYLLPTLYV